jgi:hypothetical protein
VFAHLTENYGRESLKKKEIVIAKPGEVRNNLSEKKNFEERPDP